MCYDGTTLKMAWKSSHMFLLYIANKHESSSKWNRKKYCIQNAKGNIPKMFQIVSCTMAHLSWKYHENPFMCFSVMWLTDRQIEQPTHKDENTTFTGLSSFYSLILDSSVALSAGIQSARYLVPETLWVQSCIQQRKTTCLLSILKSLACARASKLTTTNMFIARARCECQTAVGSSGLNARWS